MNFLTLEQFKEMWKLQDALNSVTSGTDWRTKQQDWNLAIRDEVMEFFNYIGWKWWKEPEKVKLPSDMQARLEAVDIWHFLLSSIIEHQAALGSIQYTYERILPYSGVEMNSIQGCKDSIKKLDSEKENNASKVTFLTDMLQLCEWTWDDLYQAYIGKVALNNFRQNNGYKEGSYVKIWGRVNFKPTVEEADDWQDLEDNYFLETIMKDLSLKGELTYDKVYNKLSGVYKVKTGK